MKYYTVKQFCFLIHATFKIPKPNWKETLAFFSTIISFSTIIWYSQVERDRILIVVEKMRKKPKRKQKISRDRKELNSNPNHLRKVPHLVDPRRTIHSPLGFPDSGEVVNRSTRATKNGFSLELEEVFVVLQCSWPRVQCKEKLRGGILWIGKLDNLSSILNILIFYLLNYN